MTATRATVHTRTARLSRVIAILTRNYLARVRSGRPTAGLLARVRPITAAYLLSRDSDRSATDADFSSRY